MNLCDYGCGQEAIHQFANGKFCCGNNVSKCPSIKKIIGETHKGMIITEEMREAVRRGRTGIKDSPETRKRKSEARKGEKNPIYGKPRSEETRRKISEARTGVKAHNKYTIEMLEEKYPFFSLIEEMRYNPDKLDEKEIQVHCKYNECENSKEKDGWFTPTSEQIYARKNNLENEGLDYSYFYCSDKCKSLCPLYHSNGRDPFKNTELPYTRVEYETWRQQVKKLDNFECQICGSKNDIHVHHIIPQKLEPFFALDPVNGICLCEKCHFKYGHSDDGCKINDISKKQCKGKE